jgi:hypothetical protein
MKEAPCRAQAAIAKLKIPDKEIRGRRADCAKALVPRLLRHGLF